jgi:hypothetical protein
MRLTAPAVAAVAVWAGLAAATAADSPFGSKPAGTCSAHGTSLEFYDTPSEAAARARAEQKLVFVLHVSGLFEDPRFT